MAKDNPWDDDYEPDPNELRTLPPYPACGGVRFPEEDSKSSIDWGFVISAFFTVGVIAIAGHLINLLLN
jgi:hypothetical protein